MSPAIRAWFATQILPLEPLLRGYLRRLAPRTETDDLLHETYARALALPEAEITRIRAVKPFILATARNAALDWQRRQRIVRFNHLPEFDVSNVLDPRTALDEALDTRRELDRLVAVVMTLPEKCREVFTLRKVYGLSQKEIAERLSITEHTVEKHVAYGMKLCTARLLAGSIPPQEVHTNDDEQAKDGTPES